VQALELNLSTRPFRNNTLLWTALTVLVVGIVAASGWNLTMYRKYGVLIESLEDQAGSTTEQLRALNARELAADQEIRKINRRSLEVQAGKANEVIRWKAFSWTRLFNQMQAIQPWDVKMTSINPVFRISRRSRDDAMQDAVPVGVEGFAKGLRDFLELERALMTDPHFDRVEPDGYNTDENSGETVFRLRFLYRAVVEDDGAIVEVEPEGEGGEDGAEATDGSGEPLPEEQRETGEEPADEQPEAPAPDDTVAEAEPEPVGAGPSSAAPTAAGTTGGE